MGMRRWLLGSGLLLSLSAHGSVGLTDEVKAGIEAMRKGDKAMAWELLFPEANKGDIQAMFYLGDMMLRSPEYADHLERAMKFFMVAGARGHEGAKTLIPQVKQLIEQKASGGLPSIGGASGMPTGKDLAEAKARFEQYSKEVLRFTDQLPSVPRLEVLVFLNHADAATERMYQLSQSLQQQFGQKIQVKFFVIINPADWKPESAPIGGTSVPPVGFTPDFKGQLAAQHGVHKAPAVVLLPPSGRPKVIGDLNSLANQITSLL